MTPQRPEVKQGERGAALLSVLLLVAVMAVIAAASLDRLTLATRIAGSAAMVDQGRAFVMAAEHMALGRVQGLVDNDHHKLTNEAGWQDRPFMLPLPIGSGTAKLQDASNCFNLNGLVSETMLGRFSQRPRSIEQLTALMTILGVPQHEAAAVAAATGDWLDSDDTPTPLGAEDAAYLGMEQGYLPANQLMVDASEWRAVRGVTPALYARMAPWICALPVAEPVRPNVNTLRPEQAALIAMMMPDGISLGAVRAALAARPRGGYGSSQRFWQSGPLAGVVPPPDVAQQVQMTSRWLELEIAVELADSMVTARTLVDAYGGAAQAGQAKAAIVRRAWGEWD